MTSSAPTSLRRPQRESHRRAPHRSAHREPATFQHNVFFCGIALVLILALFGLDVRDDALTVFLPTTLSFVILGIVSFLGLYDSARECSFSLNVSHWTYVLFFLWYAPFVQFLVADSAPQSDIGAFDRYAIWINCMTLVWCALYHVFYGSSAVSTKSQRRAPDKPQPEQTCSGWTYLIAILVCVLSFGVLLVLFGVDGVFYRGAAGSVVSDYNDKSSLLILTSSCRTMPVIITGMLMLTRGKSTWTHWGTFVFSSLFALAMNNPIAIARVWFGAILIGFCCLYLHVRKIRVTGLWIAVALTLAGLTIFPLLSATRRVTSTDQLSSVQVSNDWSSNLTEADFDGYSMIIATVEWARREGITNGYQLIGNSLFWVPRVFWYDKPAGSGQMVAEYFDMSNINMSEPMTAEAYVNFGWLGIPLYAFAIARLFAAVDRSYWNKRRGSLISVIGITYPFLTALTIYFLRGDYLSGLSSTLSLLFNATIVIWLFRLSSRRTVANPTQALPAATS